MGAEAAQRALAGAAGVFGLSIDAEERALSRAHVAELGGDDDAIAVFRYRASDELLVGERTVHVRRIETRDPELESAMYGRDGLLVVATRVEIGHAHAAEAEGGDVKVLGSESS